MGVIPPAASLFPAVEEDVDGVDEHQQGEERESDVHLEQITAPH